MVLVVAAGIGPLQAREPSAAPAMAASSIYLLPASSAREALRSASTVPTAAAPDRPRPAATTRLLIGAGSSLARASLVQMPGENVLPGGYVRPRYALGFRSSTMKNFVQGMGLEAEHCLAPLVRARLTFSPQGDAGGRLMVFARCTLR
ncbi:MAG: hypothetical protein MUC68_01875 [Burkholderiaceae bacterium]|jgi:hypothetical protein|nr:hypothetical protein [Burkholderiaceae bacterium]